MIKLFRNLCLPHSRRKAQLASQLRIRWSTLPPPITTSSTMTIPSTMTEASSISPQPTLSSQRHVTAAFTPSGNKTRYSLATPERHPPTLLSLLYKPVLAVPDSQMYFSCPASSLQWNHIRTCTCPPSSTWWSSSSNHPSTDDHSTKHQWSNAPSHAPYHPAHACHFRSCGGAHPATQCTLGRSSPRKR